MDELEKIENEEAAEVAEENQEAEVSEETETEKTAESETPKKKESKWHYFWHSTTWKKDRWIFVLKEFLSYVLIIILAFVIAVFINIFVFRLSNVVGESMMNTYTDGQQVWATRLPYLFGEPKFNDVVIFDSSLEMRTLSSDVYDSIYANAIVQKLTGKTTNVFYIKRVIGVAGDVIEFKDGKVYRNGEELDESAYVNQDEVPNYSAWDGKSFTVKEGYVFVMGDNRNHSSDSRYFGAIPLDCILGKVMIKGALNK